MAELRIDTSSVISDVVNPEKSKHGLSGSIIAEPIATSNSRREAVPASRAYFALPFLEYGRVHARFPNKVTKLRQMAQRNKKCTLIHYLAHTAMVLPLVPIDNPFVTCAI